MLPVIFAGFLKALLIPLPTLFIPPQIDLPALAILFPADAANLVTAFLAFLPVSLILAPVFLKNLAVAFPAFFIALPTLAHVPLCLSLLNSSNDLCLTTTSPLSTAAVNSSRVISSPFSFLGRVPSSSCF